MLCHRMTPTTSESGPTSELGVEAGELGAWAGVVGGLIDVRPQARLDLTSGVPPTAVHVRLDTVPYCQLHKRPG